MSLIGVKVQDIVPADAKVVRKEKSNIPDSSGNPTGYVKVDEFVDLDGDDQADFKRVTVYSPSGKQLGGQFFVSQGGKGAHAFDLFGDQNADGVIDLHTFDVESKGTNDVPWLTESYGYIDRNFDGMTDRRYRYAGGADTSSEWVLEDTDFDGTYDAETRYTQLPSQENPSGTSTTRKVAIDVEVME